MAFLDKAFGLGYATASKDAWIDGGSPTFGVLSFGAAGPFKEAYNSIAGDAWTDWLFMLGLLAIGVALVLGVFRYLAAGAGALLLLLAWTAVPRRTTRSWMTTSSMRSLLACWRAWAPADGSAWVSGGNGRG